VTSTAMVRLVLLTLRECDGQTNRRAEWSYCIPHLQSVRGAVKIEKGRIKYCFLY